MTRTLALTLVVASAVGWPAAAQQPAAKKSLYLRLGGYDAIAKVVDDFLPRLLKEPRIASMIGGFANTSKMRNRQLIVDQICHETGGPCLYIGRTMEQAHQGLQITDELWQISQKAMGETLDANGIKEPEKSELIAVIEKLRPEIVEKKTEPKKAP